jgi:enoyl-CoA hydratase
MPRFVAQRRGRSIEIVFDDGGMNLLSSGALDELTAIVHETAGHPGVLLFRSGRPATFAAGADIAEMRDFDAHLAARFALKGQELFRSIETSPQPTIAWIDGDCFGGALDLVLAFDIRWCSPRTRFSHPGARLGIVTGFGGTSRLPRTVRRKAARSWLLGNGVISAAEALACGLVSNVTTELDWQAVESISARAERRARALRAVRRLAASETSSSLDELSLLASRMTAATVDVKGSL